MNDIIPGPIPKRCPQCNNRNDGTVQIRSQYTAYTDEHRNYATCCEKCQEHNDEYWAEMWEEYYRNVY